MQINVIYVAGMRFQFHQRVRTVIGAMIIYYWGECVCLLFDKVAGGEVFGKAHHGPKLGTFLKGVTPCPKFQI